MPEFKKIITIKNEIVLSRKKTFFHDAEYSKKRIYRRVSIYRPDGTLLKSEEIGPNEPWKYNYKKVKEYDENQHLVRELKYDDESRYSPNSVETNTYNSEGRQIERTRISNDKYKYVYHYHFRVWIEDGWRNIEWKITCDEYEKDFLKWEFKKSKNCYKETRSTNPDKTYCRKELYWYQDGGWSLDKSDSYSIYYDIEGNESKRVYDDGDICFYQDYNSHGDYETFRIQHPDGTIKTTTYRYEYDFNGKTILEECFKEGIKQWEIIRDIEYSY